MYPITHETDRELKRLAAVCTSVFNIDPQALEKRSRVLSVSYARQAYCLYGHERLKLPKCVVATTIGRKRNTGQMAVQRAKDFLQNNPVFKEHWDKIVTMMHCGQTLCPRCEGKGYIECQPQQTT